ncbi:MAG: sugar ABC transporter permease [Clostridia bacterium]|nr:sugar ABC transporter permease [Clostridia bacterium]
MEKTLKIKRHRHASLDARKARAGYWFTLPFILGVVLIYLPLIIDSLWFSFAEPGFVTDNAGNSQLVFTKPESFFGFYANAFKNQSFVSNLLAGLQQLILEVPAIIIFALFIAVVLNQKMLGRALFRAIFFVPVIISTGLMDSINNLDAISDSASGGVDTGAAGGTDQIISVLDIEKLFQSMAIGSELVGYVVNLVNQVYQIINYSGVQMLIFLAGLQSISPSIYEACRIDGATAWETFWKVTFPMISPMILVNAVYTIIDAFTRSTNVTMSYITNNIYNNGARSEATAMYWIYFILVLLIIAVVAGIASTFIFYQRRD